VALALGVVVALSGGACESDDVDEGSGVTFPRKEFGEVAGTTLPRPDEPLRILVTNDDGVEAEGIDALVVALTELPDVEVTVVAPLENQSGSADTTTEGEVAAQPATTASGFEAVGVDGFPADSVIHALDVLELDPHVVVSGVNEGTNIGPIEQISGTVGAAKTAARAGYPALALSQGYGSPIDYSVTVEVGVEWIEEHRDELVAGTAPVQVVSVNGPTCPTGEYRGAVETELATEFAGRDPLVIDCSGDGPPPEGDDVDDVAVYIEGWASVTVVDHEPTTDTTDAGTTEADDAAGGDTDGE
jgi:5'-nucleotidase